MRGATTLLAACFLQLLQAQPSFDPASMARIAAGERGGHHCGAGHARSTPGRGYDMAYHRLELQVDPAVRAVNGSVTHYFTPLEDLETLLLDLSQELAVLGVTRNGLPVAWSRTGDTLLVHHAPALPAGQLDSVTIAYGGVPPETGFGSFVQQEHNGVPVIWTLSQPYGARDWWPCKHDLNDKADSVDVYVTTTDGNKVASNGLLVAELDALDGNIEFRWKHRYPIAHYLVAFAVTNYTVDHATIDMQDAQVSMETWSYPEDEFMMLLNAGDVHQQMPLFSTLFGTYPFAQEKYGHAQISWGGGMEHQTMSFMGGFSYELAAHELAHQWFGDKVTCASWEDLWLNEGFASYLSGLCYDFLAPQYWHPWKQAQIASIISQPDGSVRVTDTLDIGRLFDSRLTYRKGAFVLHMLRWIMGDEAFFQGCRNYLNDPALAFGSARTADLQLHLEEASGLDLSGFLADWFHGEGHPMYLVEWGQDPDGLVSATLWQTPSHPSVDFFELPVPLGFSAGDMDTVVVLDHQFSGQVFSFHLPFQAELAVLDPDLWLISGQNMVVSVPPALQHQPTRLVPNPATDAALLLAPPHFAGPAHLLVHDLAGRRVMEQRIHIEAGRSAVDLGPLHPGSYLLEVRPGDHPPFVLRFVKQ
jgi:aminopeptidase N